MILLALLVTVNVILALAQQASRCADRTRTFDVRGVYGPLEKAPKPPEQCACAWTDSETHGSAATGQRIVTPSQVCNARRTERPLLSRGPVNEVVTFDAVIP